MGLAIGEADGSSRIVSPGWHRRAGAMVGTAGARPAEPARPGPGSPGRPERLDVVRRGQFRLDQRPGRRPAEVPVRRGLGALVRPVTRIPGRAGAARSAALPGSRRQDRLRRHGGRARRRGWSTSGCGATTTMIGARFAARGTGEDRHGQRRDRRGRGAPFAPEIGLARTDSPMPVVGGRRRTTGCPAEERLLEDEDGLGEAVPGRRR